MRTGFCATVFTACLWGHAFAQSDLYGIEFGKLFAVAECQKTTVGGGAAYVNRTSITSPCAMAYPVRPGAGDFARSATIVFPRDAAPRHLRDPEIHAVIVDGRLEALFAWTTGQSSQGAMLQDLRSKFGEPSQQDVSTVSNAFGARYDSFTASWDRGDPLQIRFYGMLDRVDRGFLIVGTKRGNDEHAARLRSAAKKTVAP